MDSLATHVQPFFGWLIRTTWQAGLLVCLILLIEWAMGRRLGVRGRHLLWLVLLIRLALPWAPASRLSLYNLLPRSVFRGYEASIRRDGDGTRSVGADGIRAADAFAASASAANGPSGTGLADGASVTAVDGATSPTIVLLSLLWLAGACSLAGYIVACNVRLRRLVRQGRPVTDPQTLDLLDQCRRQMRTRNAVALIAVDNIDSPALSGLIQPRLLLPSETLAAADPNELRHIFLHEFAHLRRHDVLIGCVASALHVLHWFNPLIALGFRQMRADRELACDALALSVLGPEETSAYGRTVIHQIERLLASRWHPILARLCGDRRRTKQRIAMIARFQKGAYRWSPLAIVLVGALACAGLTDERTVHKGLRAAASSPETARSDAEKAAGSPDPRVAPMAHEGNYANIIRVHIRHKETGKYLVTDGDGVACDANEPGDAGLWEARFDGSLGHNGNVCFYSVATGRYLTTDAQGNLATTESEPNAWARWIVRTGPWGVWVVSREFKDAYLSLDRQGRAKAMVFNRDAQGTWDIDQIWRARVSDEPGFDQQWYGEHVPGPD